MLKHYLILAIKVLRRRKFFTFISLFGIMASIESGFGASILMTEQIHEALQAGRLVQLGPELPAMKRIIVRAPRAPRGRSDRELAAPFSVARSDPFWAAP